MAAEDKTTPWEGDGSETSSFGAWLRRQREVREISLREIATTSKISIRYLEALEQDRFEVLPAPLFAKGFLREYAKFVGLDPDEVVNYYLSALPEEESETPPQWASERTRRRVSPATILALLLLLLLSVLIVWFVSFRSERSAEAPPSIAAPVPGQQPVALEVQPVEEVSAPLRVALDFNQKSWVEAFVDGERQVSEFRVQGESLTIAAQREIRIDLGNPSGVGIELNGRPYLPQVGSGETIVIDLATLEGQ